MRATATPALPAKAPGRNQLLPKRLPVEFATNPLKSLEELTAGQGDVAEMKFGRRRAFVFNHPDLVRDLLVTNSRLFIKGEGLQRAKRVLGNGLLTSEGEFHLRQRRLLQPVFLKSRIRDYADAMGRHTVRVAQGWSDGRTMNVAEEMNRLTLAVVAETLFSADIQGDAHGIGESLDTALELFQRLNSPLAPLLELLPFGPMANFRKAKAQLDAVIYRLIDDHQASGNDTGDLLSLLLGARYEDGSRMEPEQLRDEAMTILLAGHETTSNALSWSWMLLAQNPEIQRRLHEEAVRVMGNDQPCIDHLEYLTYARQVISESMRLCPPAWIIGRAALTDYTVEHEGVTHAIPQGSIIAVSQWLLHRDPRFWEHSKDFRPERWEYLPPDLPKFAYFPFGAGPRQCIGEGFAWMESILLLSGLSRYWRLELRGPVPGFQPRITLRPAGPLWMSAHRW